MSRAVFFPYSTAGGAIGLSCEPATDAVEEAGRTILAQGLGENEELRLDLRADFDAAVLSSVLPEEELEDPPVALVVALRSVTSRQRARITLDADEQLGRYTGSASLLKREYFGDVEVLPALVRSRAGGGPGYARHAGAMLAWGDALTVRVDEPPAPPGDYLEVEFEDFLSSGSRRRRANPELLYMLDTGREMPKLWLNTRVQDFEQVMRTTAPRGRIRRIRDAMYDTIVSQVWSSLASIAFTALAMQLAATEGDETAEDPLEALPEWEQRVISLWAPKLYPGTREEAMQAVQDAARSPVAFAELHDQLGVAIQQWARSPEAFRGLMRWYHEENV